MERKDVQAKYKWHVEDVFPSDEAWEKAFSELEGRIDFSKYRGTLHTAENILAYFKAEEAFSIAAMRVYLYAFLKHDEDVRVTKYNSYLAKILSLLTKAGAETAFATPELTALSEETLDALISDPRLKDYDYMLSRTKASKKYTLSEREEVILTHAGEPLNVAGDVFEMLDNAELDLPEMEYEGEKIRLSHGMYSVITNGSDRAKRAEAFKLYYSAATSRQTSSIKRCADTGAVSRRPSSKRTSRRASMNGSWNASMPPRPSCTAIWPSARR